MSNYKTITDTGPYTFSPSILRLQQAWPHGPTASPGNSNRPPGSLPPLIPDKQSPPSFLEQGSKTRWLLFLLPFLFSRYVYQRANPFGLQDTQFYKFYLLLFLCSVFITHLALNAKRRHLRNLLHDIDDTPYNLGLIQAAFNRWANTTIIPLLCIAIGFAKFIQQLFLQSDAQFSLICTTAVALFFLAVFRANNYSNTYNAIYRIPPPCHVSNLSTESRGLLTWLGTLGLTYMWYHDNMVEWGLLEPEDEEFTARRTN